MAKDRVSGLRCRSTITLYSCPRHDPYGGCPCGNDGGHQSCAEATPLGRNAYAAHFWPLPLPVYSQPRTHVGLRRAHAADPRRERGSDTAVWILSSRIPVIDDKGLEATRGPTKIPRTAAAHT